MSTEQFDLAVKALRAHRAWDLAERTNIGTFHDRMELCNYAQWLTEKTLRLIDGEPEGEPFEGVPRLLLNPATFVVDRVTIDEGAAQSLVDNVAVQP